MDGEVEEAPHVLAVDDSLLDRTLLEKMLKRSSCRVTTAENGYKALEYLGLVDNQNNSQRFKVSMIITDYCMPGMNGYELLKRIKESTSMKDVPVIVMSSENVPSRINKCLEGGAEMFVAKPVRISDVKKLRTQFLSKSSTSLR